MFYLFHQNPLMMCHIRLCDALWLIKEKLHLAIIIGGTVRCDQFITFPLLPQRPDGNVSKYQLSFNHTLRQYEATTGTCSIRKSSHPVCSLILSGPCCFRKHPSLDVVLTTDLFSCLCQLRMGGKTMLFC